MTLQVTATATAESPISSFKLKGGLFPMTVLELNHFTVSALSHDLQQKVAQAPNFFQHTPVILSTDTYTNNPDEIDLAQVRSICFDFGLQLVALSSDSDQLQKNATALGIGLIAPTKHKNKSHADVQEQSCAYNNPLPVLGINSEHSSHNNKVVTTPIRSGQQVYAVGGDLIVMAPVSAGAEILADGNIHVYAPVRGRVLAGVRGDTRARIFCQSLEAELISIAGHFTTQEDSNSQYWKQAVHIHLSVQALCIEPLYF